MNRGVTATVMQSDGNLVSYAGTTPMWDSATGGNPGAYLALQDDGFLYIYAFSGTVIKTWPARTLTGVSTSSSPSPPMSPPPLVAPPQGTRWHTRHLSAWDTGQDELCLQSVAC